MVARLFRLFCDETCGTHEEEPDDRHLFLSRVHERLTIASAGGRDGAPRFMQRWRNFKLLFTHRSYTSNPFDWCVTWQLTTAPSTLTRSTRPDNAAAQPAAALSSPPASSRGISNATQSPPSPPSSCRTNS
ncbi:hypothetical protein PR002_g18776 [Phytophthora rubi]|nr:hypothetical protein PR002_g18776 [Phytophthora rubi]